MKKIYALLSGCILSIAAFAQPAGWSYAQPLLVQNNTASLVTNYQMMFTYNTQTPIGLGQMNANGNDIRFGKTCAGTTLFNYWIESGINTTTTTIWVKIDTIPASGSVTIFMFYGNSSAAAASAVPGVFIGPHSSTDSVASGGAGGSGNTQRGFRFAPTQDILMTHVGKREPNGTTRTVTLFNFATQAIVTQQTVGGPAAQYSYNALTSAVWLTSGTQYLLELYQAPGDGYYFGTSSQIGQHMIYFDMRYCNSCTQNTFPTNVLSNYHYGYPDMWYWTKQTIAAAPTVTPTSVSGGSLTTTVTGNSTVCPTDSATVSISASGGTGNYSYTWSPTTGMANPNSATTNVLPPTSGMYYCTVTDPCGNSNMDSIYVTVLAAPNVTASVSTDSVCLGASFTPSGGGAVSYTWSGGLSDGIAFTPSVTNNYTVTGTDANGCTNYAMVTVEVLPLPSVVAGASDTVVCEGDLVTFNGSGASSYTWDNSALDNVPVAVTASAMYHVTGTDLYGCVNWDSISIIVNTLPSVAMSGPGMACDMDAAFTLVGTPSGGTFSGPGVTGNQFDPSVATAGTHTLMYAYTDSLTGCVGYDSISVVVDLCLGISGNGANGINVMPNPFSTELNFNLTETTNVRIYNSLGQMVFEQEFNAGRGEIITSEFTNGVYFMEFTSANVKSTSRVVKGN